MKGIIICLMAGVVIAVATTLFSMMTTVPLLSLVRFGLLDQDPLQVALGFLANRPSSSWVGWVLAVVQTILTFSAQLLLFRFVRNVFSTFPLLDGYFRGLYSVFFALVFFIPVGLVYLYIFLQFPLGIFLSLVSGFVTLAATGITIVIRKVLPETEVRENREVLFSRGKK